MVQIQATGFYKLIICAVLHPVLKRVLQRVGWGQQIIYTIYISAVQLQLIYADPSNRLSREVRSRDGLPFLSSAESSWLVFHLSTNSV